MFSIQTLLRRGPPPSKPKSSSSSSLLPQALNTTDVPAVTTRILNGGKGTANKAQVQQWFKVARVRTFTYEVVPDPPSTTDLAASTGSMLEMNSKLSGALTADYLKLIEARQLILYV